MKSLYIFLFLSTLTFHMDTTCMLLRRLPCRPIFRSQQQRRIQPMQARRYNAGHGLEDPLFFKIVDLEKRITHLEKAIISKNEQKMLGNLYDTSGPSFQDREMYNHLHDHDTYIELHNMHYRTPAKE